MGKHNETGIKGEQIAENFLQKKSYKILYRNWRSGKMEVDIIASKNDILILAEVKTRHRVGFGFPEDAVRTEKQQHLKNAAEILLETHPEFKKIQFDVISIVLDKGEIKEIVHFEDAFY